MSFTVSSEDELLCVRLYARKEPLYIAGDGQGELWIDEALAPDKTRADLERVRGYIAHSIEYLYSQYDTWNETQFQALKNSPVRARIAEPIVIDERLHVVIGLSDKATNAHHATSVVRMTKVVAVTHIGRAELAQSRMSSTS